LLDGLPGARQSLFLRYPPRGFQLFMRHALRIEKLIDIPPAMSFLDDLKRETMASHIALEKNFDLPRRIKTVQDYRALLERFFTIYEPLEAKLAAALNWEEITWNFSARLKSPWLREDLLALGLDPNNIPASERCDHLPAIDNAGVAVGVVYVIEGSTLGGQILTRHFHDTLGITPDHGGRFFRGYGAETGSRWREFRVWAEAHSASASKDFAPSAVRGARETFQEFSRWLT
jgi:heme oxygenase (biliverdin-IX-beta and delta-forming)